MFGINDTGITYLLWVVRFTSPNRFPIEIPSVVWRRSMYGQVKCALNPPKSLAQYPIKYITPSRTTNILVRTNPVIDPACIFAHVLRVRHPKCNISSVCAIKAKDFWTFIQTSIPVTWLVCLPLSVTAWALRIPLP